MDDIKDIQVRSEAFHKLCSNPWRSHVLSTKLIELICVALNAACTNLNEEGLRRHMKAAMAAGARREEIVVVLKMASVLGVHSSSLAAPVLIEESAGNGHDSNRPSSVAGLEKVATPACDMMKSIGQWNVAWDPFFALAPEWTDQLMSFASEIYSSGILPAREIELISIALDASVTHMYAPGVKRHVKAALAAGATEAEIMEVLKLCFSMGEETLLLGEKVLNELS